MLSILSYVSGPSACPPWRSVCSGPLPIFNWIVCLPGVESREFFDLKLNLIHKKTLCGTLELRRVPKERQTQKTVPSPQLGFRSQQRRYSCSPPRGREVAVRKQAGITRLWCRQAVTNGQAHCCVKQEFWGTQCLH